MNVITNRRHMNYRFPNACDLLIANKNTWLKLALEFICETGRDISRPQAPTTGKHIV